MNAIELAFAPALEQARLIRRKEISPLELTQLYLDRITAGDDQLGSFFHVAADSAIADAKAKTEAIPKTPTEELPPFFGVPTGVKDLSSVAGMPCSYGVKILKNRLSERDDGLVSRLRQAGLVILGKTATSQLGALPYTEPPGFAPTRNPWHLDYTAGGSSGGSGAAIAAGFCAIATGSDAGGSVRIPASCCGLVGLKPSRGRVSNAPGGEYFGGFLVNGPMGRSVQDVAALLDVMAGYVTGDLYWLPDPVESFLASSARPITGLRIGLVRSLPPVSEADAETLVALDQTAAQLEDLGHTVELLDGKAFGAEQMIAPFRMIWQTQMDVGIPGVFLDKMNRSLWVKAQFTKAAKYQQAQQALQFLARRIVTVCAPYDAVLLPTVMFAPPQIREWSRLRTKRMFEQVLQWIAPAPLANISGQPAISLPLGRRANGLPIGLQLIGPPAGEELLLRLAFQLESATTSTLPTYPKIVQSVEL
jgi:amidase